MRVLIRAKKWAWALAVLLILTSSGTACAWWRGYSRPHRHFRPRPDYYQPRGVISNRDIHLRRPYFHYGPQYYGPNWNRYWRGGGLYRYPPRGGLVIIIK